MERSIFRLIRRALCTLGRRRSNRRFTFTDAGILEVYLWAALCDRPVSWACEPAHWPSGFRRGPLPDASTVSRRMRTKAMAKLIERLRHILESHHEEEIVAVVDAKPLPIGPHSHDRQSGYGRAASGKARGYKFHAIITTSGRVLAWRITPMNTDERKMARRMLRELEHTGYLLGDSNYDANAIFDAAMEGGIQLVVPRRFGRTRGLGHHYQSPARLRSKDILEVDETGFGRTLMHQRWSIERFFGTLSALPGGLGFLPAWVRSWARVRNWVAAKLVINAARSALKVEKMMQ
jgi:transposase